MKFPRNLALAAVAGLLSALPATAQKSPEESAASFKISPGLEATVWASEPDMVNPTDMDIDERGRIWVCEGANYRAFTTRPEGDRILILEDAHHTGHCDTVKVFVQDKKLQSPLGICKIGNKLYVAQSPNFMVYTIDEKTDTPIGEPEILFTGFGGVNHDHGVHAAVFGPDGRIYFNCGNEATRGSLLLRGDKTPIIDVFGSQIGAKSEIYKGKPRPKGFPGPREGMAFRFNPDGSDFEIMAYNFRNNYELALDSFGTIWQSDNDDDGNQGTVINYVMEGGNFGYTGPKGTSWGRDQMAYPGQTHQEAQWHQHWPGVVPNMLHTGQGSPCGIAFYEGDLLPEKYRGAILHADAGPNVVRAYFPQASEHVAKGLFNKDGDENVKESDGAGYKTDFEEVIKASDKWFRPDDVAVAPDGALYVSDWYDPGVGGHNTNDTGAKTHNWHTLRGRIFRVAPTGYKPSIPPLDINTIPGQIAALESPNLARRYLGYTKLAAGGVAAVKALNEVYSTSKNAFFRARALWLLARSKAGEQAVAKAMTDGDANIRVTAIRAAHQIKMDTTKVVTQMLSDPSPAVLRELCLTLRYEPNDRAIPLLVKLADKYDGTDRWYLEAFGIGANDREAETLEAWQKSHTNKDPKSEEGITWRLKLDYPQTPEPPAGFGRRGGRGGPGTRPFGAGTQPVGANAVAMIPGGAPSTGPLMTKDGSPLPPITELVTMTGNATAGEKVYRNAAVANCIKCHQIGNEGGIVGPPLTTIAQKLTKAQIYDAVLHPSAEILMGYENWIVRTKSGDILSGRKTEDTDDHVTILDPDGKYHDIPAAQVDRKVKQTISIMPDGLSQSLSRQELIDLVEFLSTRK
jgi:putative membrane-bound dehydrogenase-like protein